MELAQNFLYKCNMSFSAPRVVNYNLFGESHDLPDVVHCEAIFTRAVLHDWELTPHRHARLHQILVVSDGGGRALLEDGRHELAPMRLVNVPVGAVHGFSFTPESNGWIVTLAAEMLDESLAPQEGLRQALARPFIAPAHQDVLTTMERIFAEFAGRRFARAQILRSLCGVLIGFVARAGAEETPALESRAPGGALPQRFEALLERQFSNHWSVADYARALAVTPTHLSRVLRSATGQAASQLIQERVIREARRHLVYTNLSVAAVSYALGFDDPAYFSRVFAQATGVSPRRFRARLLEGD